MTVNRIVTNKLIHVQCWGMCILYWTSKHEQNEDFGGVVFFFKNTFWRTPVFLLGHWFLCFGLWMTSALGFKAMAYWFLRFTSGTTPADFLKCSIEMKLTTTTTTIIGSGVMLDTSFWSKKVWRWKGTTQRSNRRLAHARNNIRLWIPPVPWNCSFVTSKYCVSKS